MLLAMRRDQLRAHADAGNLTLVERYDDRDGLLDVTLLDDLVPDLAERLTYACGPAGRSTPSRPTTQTAASA